MWEMNLAPSDFIGEIFLAPIASAVGVISNAILFSVKLKFNKKFIAVVKSEINLMAFGRVWWFICFIAVDFLTQP